MVINGYHDISHWIAVLVVSFFSDTVELDIVGFIAMNIPLAIRPLWG